MTGRAGFALAALLLLAGVAPAAAQSYIEPPALAEAVAAGRLQPVAARLPRNPAVVELGS